MGAAVGRISVDRGRQTITSVLDQLRFIDPKIVPFDSPEIEDLQRTVAATVAGVFGEDSPEQERFGAFRVFMGHVSLRDSHAEKQMKFEMGIPKAIAQLEEILTAIDDLPSGAGGAILEIKAEDLVEEKPAPKTKAPEAPRVPAAPPPPPAEGPAPEENRGVLLLHTREDEMTLSVVSLLDKLGVEATMIDETQSSSASQIEGIAALPDLGFCLIILPSDDRSGLPGLTAKIAKPRHRQDIIFELGYLVGRLGQGRVAVLHGGDRPSDVPTGFFGVAYLPYQADGGWQINLIKLLKAAGHRVDANVLFE